MPKTKSHAAAAHDVGQWVRVPFGPRKVNAQIVEDRGLVGVGGRHLYVVEVPLDPLEPMRFEVPEQELEDAGELAATLDKAKVQAYLSRGGLLSILQSNISGGRNQPRVWLTLDTLGNVTHTYSEGRGAVGGATVPFWVLHGERIFTPKVDEVRELLRSFGLSADQTTQVIEAVGTAP